MVAGLVFATFAFRLTPFCGLPRVGGGDSAGGGDSDEDSASGDGEESVEGGGERDEVSDEAVIPGVGWETATGFAWVVLMAVVD